MTRGGGDTMGLAKSEAEIADRVSAYLKAELKKADVTYEELAKRLKKHGLPAETVDSIKAKLKRGTFAATFLLAAVAALESEGVRLEDI
jgi:negative regulator of sigma E activity